jgi:hypothetical protein
MSEKNKKKMKCSFGDFQHAQKECWILDDFENIWNPQKMN